MQRQRGDGGELGDPGEDHGTEQGAARKGGQDGRADGRSGGCRHKHQYQTRFYEALIIYGLFASTAV